MYFLSFQVSVIADDILKNVEFDALRVVFNKFQSVVSYLPTVSTVLSPEVSYLAPIEIRFYCNQISGN